MNRWLKLLVIFQSAVLISISTFRACSISDPWLTMLRIEQTYLFPHHIGISQFTWNLMVTAMIAWPFVVSGASTVLFLVVLRHCFRRWLLDQPVSAAAGQLLTRQHVYIANLGGIYVAIFLLAQAIWGEFVPFWIAALLAAGWTGMALEWSIRKPLNSTLCLCGYDLTGNVSGICPECGQPTSPAAHSREQKHAQM